MQIVEQIGFVAYHPLMEGSPLENLRDTISAWVDRQDHGIIAEIAREADIHRSTVERLLAEHDIKGNYILNPLDFSRGVRYITSSRHGADAKEPEMFRILSIADQPVFHTEREAEIHAQKLADEEDEAVTYETKAGAAVVEPSRMRGCDPSVGEISESDHRYLGGY